MSQRVADSMRGPARGIALILSIALPAAFCTGTAAAQQIVPSVQERQMLLQMSGGAAAALSASLGITEIAGKPVSGGPPGRANAPKLKDVAVGADATKDENEPTVAANPKDQKFLVAGSHYFPTPGTASPAMTNRCAAYRSMDGGQTWSPAFLMPHLPFSPPGLGQIVSQSCSDPVIRYAPDGSRVYYSYMDIKSVRTNITPMLFTIQTDFDIVISYSDDNGATWSQPVIALNGDPYTQTFTPCPAPPFPPGSFCGVLTEPGYAFDKNWIGVHSESGIESNWVYVTATRFDAPGPPNIAFARSSNKGATWSPHVVLDTGSGTVVVQGSHPAGGPDGHVLVAWYHSGTDGWLNGGFQIRTRHSSDHGATFDPTQTAASENYELPFWLGPFTMYKRWWGGMFPALLIDGGGAAHIVYTHDPAANGACLPVSSFACSTTAEDGDIRYLTSLGPPYNGWSLPVTVNDDGLVRAQGYPGLAVQRTGNAGTVHVIWEDSRLAPEVSATLAGAMDCLTPPLGPCDSSNVKYDIFYSRKVPGAAGWKPNFRVTEVSSTQDFIFTGDYTDVAANQRTLFGIWTDRRHQTSLFASFDDIFGSQIIPGGANTK